MELNGTLEDTAVISGKRTMHHSGFLKRSVFLTHQHLMEYQAL